MSSGSLREYLDLLEAAESLIRIDDDVSWNLQSSAVTMLANQLDEAIPLFTSVSSDGIDDAQLVGDPYRGSRVTPWDRIALALDIEKNLRGPEFYDVVIERLQSPIEPEIVSTEKAPCKEVIHRDEEADLLQFPWPYIHSVDGGRYSNLHALIAPYHNQNGYNLTYHRMMVHDSTTASLLFLAGEQTPNQFYYEFEQQQTPMPVSIAVGVEPAVQCITVMRTPTNRSKVEFAGGLKESPVELVESETNNLLVPATAEVVIEGQVIPDSRRDEGPFGDYFGYMHGPRRSMPVLKIDAITHRNRPIIPFCVEGSGVGYGVNSTSTFDLACLGPNASLGLRIAGFPINQCVPWLFSPRSVYVISTPNPYEGYLHDLANFLFTNQGTLHADYLIFVSDAVNPFDQQEVLEAMAKYADPATDFHQFGVERMPEVPLNIYQTPDEKGEIQTGTSKAKTAKAYIDATGYEPATDDVHLRKHAQEILSAAGFDSQELDLVTKGGESS